MNTRPLHVRYTLALDTTSGIGWMIFCDGSPIPGRFKEPDEALASLSDAMCRKASAAWGWVVVSEEATSKLLQWRISFEESILPEIDSEHACQITGSVYRIIKAPPGWGHLDAERDGLMLVDTAPHPTKLRPFNLHHPDITQFFPSLRPWLAPVRTP